MKNLLVSLLVVVAVAACTKKAAPVADTSDVVTELQSVVAAEFPSADAFLASLDPASSVVLADSSVVTADSLRKLPVVDFAVSVDSVSAGEGSTTAFTTLTWTGVVGTDTVTINVSRSASYTKGEAGWSKN